MEWILGIATVLEVIVIGVLVVALWQDHAASEQRRVSERELRGPTEGEELTAMTR